MSQNGPQRPVIQAENKWPRQQQCGVTAPSDNISWSEFVASQRQLRDCTPRGTTQLKQQGSDPQFEVVVIDDSAN
jgi:hypothetical protein